MISALYLINKHLKGEIIIPGLAWDNNDNEWVRLESEYIITKIDAGLDPDGQYMMILTVQNDDEIRDIMYAFNDKLPLKNIP